MTEIYGTLGPGCAAADTLEAMINAGMTGIRLNLSHVSLVQATPQLEALREAERRSGKKVRLMMDMQGPELRVGAMAQPMQLREGGSVTLGKGGVPVPAIILPYLHPGQQLLLDDGKLLVEVTQQEADHAVAAVLRGGELKGRKSIAIPGSELYPPTLTEGDLENFSHAKEFGVDELMQPFVRDRRDLETVRQALCDAGAGDVKIYAKIENMTGVEHLNELMEASDVIVIARGDLGNAMPLWELPAVQKHISEVCRKAGKPFMVATQMLTTMEKNPVPTRAEVSDIFNAVVDGASSVIVTGETAIGAYPVEVISYLTKTAAQGELWLKSR